jgi:hypothetical protein
MPIASAVMAAASSRVVSIVVLRVCELEGRRG